MGMQINLKKKDKNEKYQMVPEPDACLIAEVIERYGVDTHRFRLLFRTIDIASNKFLESLSKEEKERMSHESSHYSWNLEEIKYLKEFAEKALPIVEEHKEELDKNIVPEYQVSEYWLLPAELKTFVSICNKALKKKRDLEIG